MMKKQSKVSGKMTSWQENYLGFDNIKNLWYY